MPGGRDRAALDPSDGFYSAFHELLEVTWSEHQALVAQLERILTIERELMGIWHLLAGRHAQRPPSPAAPAPEAAAQATPRPRGLATLEDLPRVGKIRAKALKDAGYDLESLAQASVEALTEVRGVGPSVARTLRSAAQQALDAQT